MRNAVVKSLIELLDEERTALRTASFDSLEPLRTKKEQLFEQLPHSDPSKADLARIQAQLSDNQALLAAAIAGVNAARGRIAALQSVRDGLDVYDRSGQMSKVMTAHPGLQKKA